MSTCGLCGGFGVQGSSVANIKRRSHALSISI